MSALYVQQFLFSLCLWYRFSFWVPFLYRFGAQDRSLGGPFGQEGGSPGGKNLPHRAGRRSWQPEVLRGDRTDARPDAKPCSTSMTTVEHGYNSNVINDIYLC